MLAPHLPLASSRLRAEEDSKPGLPGIGSWWKQLTGNSNWPRRECHTLRYASLCALPSRLDSCDLTRSALSIARADPADAGSEVSSLW